jgi:teichoic acid transport system permease protein
MTVDVDPRPITVYEGSAARLPPLGPYFRRTWADRGLIRYLASTNLKARHYDTALGQVWLVLGPLLLAGVYLLLRLVLRPADDAAEARAIAAQLVMGVFVFQFVSQVLSSGASSIVNGKNLIVNTSIPRLVYPCVSTTEQLIDLVPSMVVLITIQALLRQPITLWLLLLPVVLLLLAVFAHGLALAAATLTVYFRDTTNLLGYFTRIWLFLSPVLYTVSEIPESLRKFMALNPLYPFFAILDPIFDGQRPPALYFLWCAAWSIAAIVIGTWVFLRKERDFALRL